MVKKTSYLGVFPKPGVSQKDIDEAKKFGRPILKDLLQDEYGGLQDNLLKIGAVEINSFLVLVDKRANVLFGKWANLIIKKGKLGEKKRLEWINYFNKYLKFAIWFITPIIFIVFLLTYLPFLGSIKKDKKYYASVNQK